MFGWIEAPIKHYLTARYGAPADATRQYQFYRCDLCHDVVTWKDIEKGGCRCGVGSRVRAAHLTLMDKCKLLFLPRSS